MYFNIKQTDVPELPVNLLSITVYLSKLCFDAIRHLLSSCRSFSCRENILLCLYKKSQSVYWHVYFFSQRQSFSLSVGYVIALCRSCLNSCIASWMLLAVLLTLHAQCVWVHSRSCASITDKAWMFCDMYKRLRISPLISFYEQAIV